MDMSTTVLIVGAGGGGAVLGIALTRKGIANIVLEQAAGPPQGIRGEILQPNGQALLHNLGLLEVLPTDAAKSVRFVPFSSKVGERDFALSIMGCCHPPYNRALVMWPNVVHHTILDCLKRENPQWTATLMPSFKSFLRDGNQDRRCGSGNMWKIQLQIGARSGNREPMVLFLEFGKQWRFLPRSIGIRIVISLLP